MTDAPQPPASPTPDEIEVTDNPARNRYEARIRDRILGFVDYTLDSGGGIVLDHTEVLPEAEGKGVGTSLAKYALEDVRARGLGLTIDCPFIAAYVRRHRTEYADLVDG
jgi:predicted GNAT family acetyltransferase